MEAQARKKNHEDEVRAMSRLEDWATTRIQVDMFVKFTDRRVLRPFVSILSYDMCDHYLRRRVGQPQIQGKERELRPQVAAVLRVSALFVQGKIGWRQLGQNQMLAEKKN